MKKLLSVLPFALLVACGSAPTRIYTLSPVAADRPPPAYSGPPVRVAAVHLPADLDRIEIVTEQDSGELRINDLDHWAAPLSKLAQQILSADLVTRLPSGKVAFPRLPEPASVVELRVDILRVPAREGTHMIASWQLAMDAHTSRSGMADLPDESRRGNPKGVVQGLDALLGHLADQIAAELPELSRAH